VSGGDESTFGFSGEAVQVAHEIGELWAVTGLRGGFCARNIDSGEALGWRADTPYPLASVVKVPVALAALDRIARGELPADLPVSLASAARAPGPTGVAAFRHDCVIALEDLLYLSLAISDNAATDAVFELVPPAAVTAALRRWGCADVVVRHTIRALYDAVAAVAPDDPAIRLELAIRATTAGGGHVLPMLDITQASHGTARGVVALLARVWTDDLGPQESTARLRELMSLQVARQRIAAELASDATTVSAKSGTFFNLRHEVGVVTTADGDRIAIAALTASTVAALVQPEADRAIGRAARLATDVLRW